MSCASSPATLYSRYPSGWYSLCSRNWGISPFSGLEVEIDFQKPFVVGDFVNRDRPTWMELMNKQMTVKLGDDFVAREGATCTSCG